MQMKVKQSARARTKVIVKVQSNDLYATFTMTGDLHEM